MEKTSKFDLSELKKHPLFPAAWEAVIAIERERAKKNYEITFNVEYPTMFGEVVVVVGNRQFLGNWDTELGIELEWSPGHLWRRTVHLSDNLLTFEYKYACVGNNQAKWERGANRAVSTREGTTDAKKIAITRLDTWQK